MVKQILSIIPLIILFAVTVTAQETFETDIIGTSGGDLTITYIGHGTLMFEYEGKIIHVDPVGRYADYNELPKANIIMITHEHGDHIQGVGALSRRFHLPVYANRKTRSAAADQLGKIRDLIGFECGMPFMIKNLNIHPFSVTHDAEDPAGFIVQRNGARIGIATDLGIATFMVKEHLKKCDLLVLEANHDPDMLLNGPYPWPLKQRVRGRTGHLSNEDSRLLLEEVLHNRLKHIILAHLSKTNNTPEKALREIGRAISRNDIHLSVSSQDVSGEIVYL